MTITDKLAEAIELAEDAMAYVPEYFANKHGMNRRMAALKEDFAAVQAADAVSAVPDGFALVPEKATPLIREALRIGMRREVPNDELCDIRWRAAIAAAKDSEQKGGV